MRILILVTFTAIIFTLFGIFVGAGETATILTSNDCIQACLDEVQTFKIID